MQIRQKTKKMAIGISEVVLLIVSRALTAQVELKLKPLAYRLQEILI
ncbi:hypothetical protein PARA125_000998 [Parachlamydia sp. AcF125]|nr:hypothetical protein [Parachlamydia sp. AcF125]